MKRKWWHDKVAYQIYPKSFYDTNGDGIGDLQGIIRKLDYLKGLGVDIIWLSPIFCSPLADQGYDISDYYNIDPRFGTMEDMDELIAEAKKRDMYILMDLVVNHCSDEHEWFQEAMRDPNGRYGKYFYIEEGKPNGAPPTNWRSYFGGSAWERVPGTENQYYLHLFHKKQPDLNWENEEVRKEVYKMVNWWLDKGLGGFRIDAIINIKKALPFKDYPADRPDGMSRPQNMLKDAKGVGVFLGELRDRTFAPHDAFSVGEVFDEKEEEIPEFIGDNGYFSSMFDFNTTIFGESEKGWYDRKDITPDDYIACVYASQEKIKNIGFLSNIIENHDEPRGASRYLPKGEVTNAGKKMLATISFMVRGIPFVYQGQEIGMENTVFHSIGEVDDISTIDEYQVALNAGLSPEAALKTVAKMSRDNARTPMQWSGGDHAGFTGGTPWLKENPNYKEINVEDQEAKEDSVLSYYKKLIALRKDPEYTETIVYGDFEAVEKPGRRLMAFVRRSGEQKLLVLANYQNPQQKFVIPETICGEGADKVLINNYPDIICNGREITLQSYQALVLKLK